jgi:signal transduction histidine kinase
MSATGSGRDTPIRILHVDDEQEFGELVQAFLQREDDDFEIITESSAPDGLARLHSDDLDCIVSDHDMPEMNGLEFLESVRGSYPEMPFILFTGKGSEEVASEAISKGVTDYLQKGGSKEQYEVLANLIRNSLEHGEQTVTIRLDPLPNGFYVEDDGPGIPETEHEKVFEAGYTTKERGTGTGLPSVQQIALAHGWKVRITESSDGGARFDFTNVERPSLE